MVGNHSHLPFHLDPRDPNFSRDRNLWRVGMYCELHELIDKTKETVAQTRALILEADRILALR